ncbi:MAG TPA: Ig-like domain-containing protein, partial [Burkholderiales bacterium]|nr:Ig-like domain-containing protein [Burkholderiales bacterium]
TALAPDPLKVFAGAKANVTATIAPAPAAAGSLSVSIDKPALATVPASVAFAAGQALVAIEVTGVAAGDAILSVSLNGASTSSKVSVLPPPPSIDSVSPASAAPGSLVTLNGQNFDPVPANNRVSFVAAGGDTAIAAAIASSGTQLTVRVPAGAVTGAVTLDNPRGTAQGPAFTVLTLDTRFTATRAGLNAPLTNPGTPVTPLVVGAIPGDTFDLRLLTDPAKGRATVIGGRLAYAANAELNGVDSFTYRATAADGSTRDGTALVKLYTGANLTRCTAVSTLAQRINVRDCAFYGEVQTRISATGAPVTVQYIAARPSSGAAPKAVVFLIGGGDFDLNFIGNAATGQASTIGANFVVRTAQIFADAGYLAIAMNKPSDLPTPGAISTIVDADLYRVSVRHAVDILGVLREVNTDGLDVFLSGTSRGAISAVAANLIAEGISLSSAVTRPSGSALFVNDPRHANLLPTFVQRPSHVLWNTLDQCQLSQPADSRALADALIAANGLSATFGFVTGGLIGDPTDPCGAQHFHGYYAIEPDAVGLITAWLDSRVAALAGNRRPDATFAVLPTAPGVPLQIDLGPLTGDADGDPLSYGLAYVGSGRGGTVTQSGAVLTYTPPAGATGGTDNFVYFVSDGRGGVNAAVITIRIGG